MAEVQFFKFAIVSRHEKLQSNHSSTRLTALMMGLTGEQQRQGCRLQAKSLQSGRRCCHYNSRTL